MLWANRQRDSAVLRTLHELASQLTDVEITVGNHICELRRNLESIDHVIADLASEYRGELRAAVTEVRAETHRATAEMRYWARTSAPPNDLVDARVNILYAADKGASVKLPLPTPQVATLTRPFPRADARGDGSPAESILLQVQDAQTDKGSACRM